MRLLAILLSLAAGANACEYVVFASGSRMRVDRHETDGSVVRLYSGTDGVEAPVSQVRGFETEECATPAPAPSPGVVSPPQPQPPPAASPGDLADAAADKYGLPRQLVRSVMAAESAFNPQAVSPKGAVGLMQLMPSTAQALSADPYDPAQNVDAGARYLRDLLLQYNYKLWHALAAYNAGPEAVAKYHGVPPYAETIGYINRIGRQLEGSHQPSAVSAASGAPD
jgi:hypothetical protein